MTNSKRSGKQAIGITAALALAGAAGSSLLMATAAQAADPVVRYVAPVASGTADGSSWANASDLAHLPRMVSTVGAGGQVLLRADAGAYTTDPVSIRRGGAAGAPVSIRGVSGSGAAMPAVINGSRANPYSATGNTGDEVFRVMGGANHLSFSDMTFNNVGTAYRVAGDVSDIDVHAVTANNVRRFFEDQAGTDVPTATIDHLTMRKVNVQGFSEGVARILYDSSDVLLEDVTGNSQQQDGDNYAMGVHLDGTAHNVTLRRVSMSNALDTLHPYWNGDGFAAESDVHDVLFDSTTSSGNSDAGYDLKASHITLNNIASSDNKKNLRLWGSDVTLNDCRLINPKLRGGIGDQTQLWLSDDAQVVANRCLISDSSDATVVFGVGTASSLAMVGGSITYSPAATLRRGPLTATVLMSGTTVSQAGPTKQARRR